MFERFLQQTDQNNEVERKSILNEIRQHLDKEEKLQDITHADVQRALKHTRQGAPGPDGVGYSHMEELN